MFSHAEHVCGKEQAIRVNIPEVNDYTVIA